jgi:hypothetical protein
MSQSRSYNSILLGFQKLAEIDKRSSILPGLGLSAIGSIVKLEDFAKLARLVENNGRIPSAGIIKRVTFGGHLGSIEYVEWAYW